MFGAGLAKVAVNHLIHSLSLVWYFLFAMLRIPIRLLITNAKR